MRRSGWLAPVLMLALPVGGQAQKTHKPSSNSLTRSAEVYLSSARKAAGADEKESFYKRTLEATQKAIERDDQNPTPYQQAGQAYLGLGDYARADSMLDKAESLWPDYEKEDAPLREAAWVELYNQTVPLLQQKKLDEAKQKLEMADQIYQGRPQARVTLASIYQNEGDYDKAISTYEGALDILNGPPSKNLKPEEAAKWKEEETRVNESLARLLMTAKKYDQAVKLFQAQVKANPDDASAKMNLATALAMTGQTDQADELYGQLLSQSGLSDTDYFNMGIGLFQAKQYQKSAQAFRKATVANPYNRDAYFNLAEALYARAQAINKADSSATAGQKTQNAAELKQLYQDMLDATQKTREQDPNNLTALQLAALASRGMGDIASSPKEQTEWKNKTLALLQKQDSAKVEVSNVKLARTGSSYTVTGDISNLRLAEGAPITVKITLLGKDGAPLDTQTVTVNAPAPKANTSFEANAASKEDVAGWKYEITTG